VIAGGADSSTREEGIEGSTLFVVVVMYSGGTNLQ
jgi:hypothetical protein